MPSDAVVCPGHNQESILHMTLCIVEHENMHSYPLLHISWHFILLLNWHTCYLPVSLCFPQLYIPGFLQNYRSFKISKTIHTRKSSCQHPANPISTALVTKFPCCLCFILVLISTLIIYRSLQYITNYSMYNYETIVNPSVVYSFSGGVGGSRGSGIREEIG